MTEVRSPLEILAITSNFEAKDRFLADLALLVFDPALD
jgi:hypothetical protein